MLRNDNIIVSIEKAWYTNDMVALKNISFKLSRGELLLVYGRSGSGKTTLLRIIAGVLGVSIDGGFKGHISIFGLNPYNLSSRRILELIAYIPQEPWYAITAPTVYGELVVNRLMVKEDLKLIPKIVKAYGLSHILNKLTYTLSAGEVQKTVIASNTVRNPTLILLDEPSNYIDYNSRVSLVSFAEELLSEGKTIIVVDHNTNLWWNLASKLLVIDKGTQVYFGEPDYSYIDEISFERKPRIEDTDNLLVASNLWYRYPGTSRFVLQDISLELREGEVLWIKGPNGSGKTTLLKILSGVLKPTKGFVKRLGKTVYVPENPLLYFSEPTISEEVRDESLLSLVGLRGMGSRRLVDTSSGERRRAAIASAIARGYRIICLDEPTAGLDPYSKALVFKAITTTALRKRVGFIIAGHDEDLHFIADHVLELGDK